MRHDTNDSNNKITLIILVFPCSPLSLLPCFLPVRPSHPPPDLNGSQLQSQLQCLGFAHPILALFLIVSADMARPRQGRRCDQKHRSCLNQLVIGGQQLGTQKIKAQKNKGTKKNKCVTIVCLYGEMSLYFFARQNLDNLTNKGKKRCECKRRVGGQKTRILQLRWKGWLDLFSISNATPRSVFFFSLPSRTSPLAFCLSI